MALYVYTPKAFVELITEAAKVAAQLAEDKGHMLVVEPLDTSQHIASNGIKWKTDNE